MFSIGEFAQLTRVSVKMLRHYDAIGLLPPAWVDPRTGYRWYSATQLPAVNRILLLRELGFGLDEIDTADADAAYERRERELRDLLSHTAAQLRAVRARRAMLASAGLAGLTDVVVRPVPAELVATLRAEDDVSAAFYTIEEYVQRHTARAPRPPMTLLAADGSTVVAVPVTWRLPATIGITVTELPPVTAMASAVHRGPYAELGAHRQRMLAWLQRTGQQPASDLRWVYLRFDAEPELRLPPVYLTDDPDELVTELQVPLRQPTPR